MPKERVKEIPDLLRLAFQHPQFKTKALRMGKILRLTDTSVTFYEANRHIKQFLWE
jgi:hypothetical protein